ncbi:MAG: hypothetical protein ACREUQ_12320 [Burkholderiales bacterium]
MLRFSPIQILLLTVGSALIFLALVLDQAIELWEEPIGASAVQWHHLRLVPQEDQQLNALDPRTLVVRSSQFPDARLTLFTRADDGSTPSDLVRDLCRRDHCTYSTLNQAGDSESAVATYPSAARLRIVLIRPGGKDVWIEFKGPPDAYRAFTELIDSVSAQLSDRPAGT